MEISRNAQSQPSPLRYDLTRPNRESIQERQPLSEPVKTEAQPPVDPEQAAKEVREARDAYRDARQTRIANARAQYTANNAPRFAERVGNVRDTYRARLDERAKNTQGAGAPQADRLEISDGAKELVDRAMAFARGEDSVRSERLAELKSLYEQGKLNTDEIVARAAHRMLGGE